MRILLTVASLSKEYGGPANKAIRLAAALRARGHSAEILACGEHPQIATVPTIGRFHGTPIPRRFAPLTTAVGAADVVHIIGLRDPVGTIAALAARRMSVPFVLEPAGMLRPKLRSFRLKGSFDATIGRAVVGGASAVIATSTAEAKEIAGWGIREDRVRVRFNGVELDGVWPLPARGPLRRQFGIPPEAPLLLTLSRIAAIKGLPQLAEAVDRLPWLNWLVVGPDEGDGTLEAIRQRTARFAMPDRVVICPSGLWGPDKAAALAEADAFCMASSYESFGSAAAEAACAEIPVVITDACGVLDCLIPESTRTYRYGDVDALTEALRWACQDPTARTAAVAGGVDLRQRLDWAGIADDQLDIYAAVLSPSRPSV